MSEYDEDLNNEAKEIVDDNFNVDKEIIDILKDMLNSKNLDLKTEIPKKEFEKIYRLAILKNEIKQYSPKSYKLISSLLSIRFRRILFNFIFKYCQSVYFLKFFFRYFSF